MEEQLLYVIDPRQAETEYPGRCVRGRFELYRETGFTEDCEAFLGQRLQPPELCRMTSLSVVSEIILSVVGP